MIIRAELKCKQTGGGGPPPPCAAWILQNTVRVAWKMTV